MSAPYAAKTAVPVERSIAEIRRVVAKHRGAQFVFGVAETHLVVGFTRDDRQVRFQVAQDVKSPQRSRSLARALLLVVKAKLEAVEAGISIFEDEFMANIVLPNGQLVSQQVRPAIAQAYASGDMPNLLPDYSGGAA